MNFQRSSHAYEHEETGRWMQEHTQLYEPAVASTRRVYYFPYPLTLATTHTRYSPLRKKL